MRSSGGLRGESWSFPPPSGWSEGWTPSGAGGALSAASLALCSPLYVTVVYRGKCSHCMRIGVAVPLSGTVAQLREAVARETKIPAKQVRGGAIWVVLPPNRTALPCLLSLPWVSRCSGLPLFPFRLLRRGKPALSTFQEMLLGLPRKEWKLGGPVHDAFMSGAFQDST